MSNADSHDLSSLLSGSDRDYLIRNNNDEVKIDSLKGKKVGLYFSASWCGPCHRFTPKLVEAYNELGPQANFEVVFVSGDENEESFQAYFSKMPWLAVPFSDSDVRDRLDDVFKVNGIPHLVILNENGDVSTEDGVGFIREFGAEGYPFTQEKLKELQEKEKEAKRNQTLKSVLAFGSRDYVISSNGDKVPVSELEGKTVALYFVLCSYPSRSEFTTKLAEVYEKLKAKGEKFEIVLVPLDDDEEAFNQLRGAMPWLALPVNDKNIERLAGYFEISFLPTVVILGPDGKTLHRNVAEAIEEHGVNAYPFTPEKFLELAEVEKARAEAQTLESILVKGDLDFVLGKDGYKIPVADLVGKNVCLYFSAHWCPPCRAFLPKLVEAYNEIKAKDDAFEVIFISSDRDQASYDEYFHSMPWLALPFGDERKKSLSKTFKVQGIPMLVALGPSGRTVNTKARELIMVHGGDAYPFTDERVKELEAKFEEMKKGWPEKIKHELHDKHELVLTRFTLYCCDGCNEEGHIWSFHCEECNFDLHPKCALKEDKETKDDGKEEQTPNEEWICDGDVCKRA